MDNQTALSSLRDSEARLQSALDHVQAAIKVLRPAELLPAPAGTPNWAKSKAPIMQALKERMQLMSEFDPKDIEGMPRFDAWAYARDVGRGTGRPTKRYGKAWRRKVSAAQKAVWASYTPEEHAERVRKMQEGRRAR